MSTQLYPDWQEHTADGDKLWTVEWLGCFAKVKRFGQSWRGRVWPQNDDDATVWHTFSHPSLAMASLTLEMEASARGAS